MKKKLLLVTLFLIQFCSFSQVEDAWVYLADKENVAQSISNPISILTQRAIDRKTNQGIAIDQKDVPVNEFYISALKNANGISVLSKSKWFNAVHVRGAQIDIEALLTNPNTSFVTSIEYASGSISTSRLNSPVNKFEFEETNVDLNYGDTENQVQMLNLHLLHSDDFTGEGVLVAVLDAGFSGVETINAFSRLRNNGDLLDGYDFVDRTTAVYDYTGNTHGTKVLSTMAAYIDNQYVGTAPDASYYVFRTEDAGSENPVEESYWVEAAERADSLGVDIINTSLGYKDYDNPSYTYTNTDLDGYTTYITRGANMAFQKGLLLVNSAGNSGASGLNAPADSPYVITVGAVDASGNYASFSSQGSAIQPTQKPNLVARGLSSFVVSSTNAIVQNNGTSFSSPILAGALACLKQALPNSSNEELIDFIQESASQFLNPDYYLGYGIPDFEQAKTLGLEYEASKRQEYKIYPNPVKDILNLQFYGTVEEAEISVFDILGKQLFTKELTINKNTIDFSEVRKGIYIVTISTKKADVKTFKLIKE
ncbi:MAG: S8 family serine peptidase [Flavobacteriaceae bacterium]|nr:S8 family serine peptidase [Flavobacteriaceae bacterium]